MSLSDMLASKRLSRAKLLASYAVNKNVLAVMIIRCKIYFVFFYFRGLRKPRKYFYNKNFQIYGIYTQDFKLL